MAINEVDKFIKSEEIQDMSSRVKSDIKKHFRDDIKNLVDNAFTIYSKENSNAVGLLEDNATKENIVSMVL